MDHLRMVESRIQEAMAAGVFEGLHGRGQPLDLRAGELAGDLWPGHHILEPRRPASSVAPARSGHRTGS